MTDNKKTGTYAVDRLRALEKTLSDNFAAAKKRASKALEDHHTFLAQAECIWQQLLDVRAAIETLDHAPREHPPGRLRRSTLRRFLVTDLRARLADALREHQPMFDGEINAASCGCGELEWVPEHLADVLLSLPGIAIVEVPEVATIPTWRDHE